MIVYTQTSVGGEVLRDGRQTDSSLQKSHEREEHFLARLAAAREGRTAPHFLRCESSRGGGKSHVCACRSPWLSYAFWGPHLALLNPTPRSRQSEPHTRETPWGPPPPDVTCSKLPGQALCSVKTQSQSRDNQIHCSVLLGTREIFGAFRGVSNLKVM